MKENYIIITSDSNKKFILKNLSKNKTFYNIKFYSFNELKKKLFFDYNNKTIEFTMSKLNISYLNAENYIKNLYYLKNINNSKIKFLNDLKKDLEENNLLIKDLSFKNYIEDKKIIVYGYSNFTKEQKLILSELETNIEYIYDKKNYTPIVYEANTEDEEVLFVVNKISELITNGIDINKIKIIAKKDYFNTIKRYFNIFNVPINIKSDNAYFSTILAKDFLSNYDNYTIEENINVLKEKYNDINNLINIINKSVLIEDKNIRKEFIINDLKNTKVKLDVYDNAIEICDLDKTFLDDEYVFLLGFNINSYPKVYKDDDYLNDNIKNQIGIDTSIDINKYEKETIINKISNIKNLVITYKLHNKNGVFYPSLLINELGLEVKKIEINESISYSKLNSKLMYAKDLDNLYKYNIFSKNLGLYKNNLNINYREYNNEFKNINNTSLKNKIGNELVLAYTNMEIYNECSFRYYLSKILKIDIFEENFKTIVGNIVHHILEIGINKDISINVEIIKFIKEKDYALTAKEYFYLEKLSEELKQILEILKEQESHSKLKKYLFESELYVYNDKDDINITFKGLIDKVMYNEIDGKEVLAVVDYKTGNKAINLDTIEYGLNMQLPIYLYLLKKSDRFKDATIAGFYLQKVLDNVPNINAKKSLREIKEDNLKLNGFSNSSETILELIDDNFRESSYIKGLGYKKDGTLKKTAKVLSNKEMDELTNIVEEKIEECINNILNGKFSINPKVINGKNISCEYCKFKDICFKEKKNEIVLGGEYNEVDGGTTVSN